MHIENEWELCRMPIVYFVFITKTHSPRQFKLIKISYIGNNELFNQLKMFKTLKYPEFVTKAQNL